MRSFRKDPSTQSEHRADTICHKLLTIHRRHMQVEGSAFQMGLLINNSLEKAWVISHSVAWRSVDPCQRVSGGAAQT